MYMKHGRTQSLREEEMMRRLRARNVHPAAIRKYRKDNCIACQRTRKQCACDLATDERDEIVYKNLLKELKENG